MKHRYCFALDLKDDPKVIEGYKKRHDPIPPHILKTIIDAGIDVMDIYITGNRLFMIMETNETFSFSKKDAADAADPLVQEWEQLMWTYQQPLPWAKPGEKWVLMEQLFKLK